METSTQGQVWQGGESFCFCDLCPDYKPKKVLPMINRIKAQKYFTKKCCCCSVRSTDYLTFNRPPREGLDLMLHRQRSSSWHLQSFGFLGHIRVSRPHLREIRKFPYDLVVQTVCMIRSQALDTEAGALDAAPQGPELEG